MQEGKFIEQAKTVLGYPVVAVYTTDDMIKQFVDLGFGKLRNKVLRKVTFALPIKDVQKINPEEVPLITDVVPYTNNADRQVVYVRDDFDLAMAIEYFNVYSQGLAIPILATMTYNQLNNAFNNKFDWHYDRHAGLLYTTKVPVNATFLAVEAKTYYTMETLTPELEDWLNSYVRARTKQTEGRIRSKYKEGSVGAVSDGDALVAEGNQELADAEAALENFVSYDIGRRR